MNAKSMSRLVRQSFPGRNTLADAGYRWEGAVLAAPVMATWQLPSGSARQGPVDARYGSAAGTIVRIWIDESGGVTKPPMTTAGAAVTAAVSAFVLWCALAGAMALLYLIVRLAHGRIRLRRWTNEWERIAPEWTGR